MTPKYCFSFAVPLFLLPAGGKKGGKKERAAAATAAAAAAAPPAPKYAEPPPPLQQKKLGTSVLHGMIMFDQGLPGPSSVRTVAVAPTITSDLMSQSQCPPPMAT